MIMIEVHFAQKKYGNVYAKNVSKSEILMYMLLIGME